jgi:cyclophilin family peptidyl-prolyl cis-trans isomerase
MANETTSPTSATRPPAPRSALPTSLPKQAKIVIGVIVVAAVALVAWLLVRAAGEEKRLDDWDVYYELREQNEWEEMFFEGDQPLYQQARDKYVRQLEAFIATLKDAKDKDALEPQARWRVAMTEAESLMSMKDVLEVTKRLPHTQKALAQLEVLEKDFPAFPLNWGQEFAPPGFATTTRRLVDWFKKNAEWEQTWLPKDVEPDGGVDVVLRTDAGDLHLRLYATAAPTASARFLAAVRAGAYDGTVFTSRVEDAPSGETRAAAVRAGDPRSRDAVAHNREAAQKYAKPQPAEGFLPDESRNRVRHVRGVMSAWHPEGDEYDHPVEVLFVQKSSPAFDYVHTPIGKLVTPASLETLDRIYSRKVWSDDALVARDTGDLRALEDLYQAPVRILIALAYKDGQLLAAEGPTLPGKATPKDSERTLSGLKVDEYKTEPPAPPAPPVAPAPEPAPAPAPDAPKTPEQPK